MRNYFKIPSNAQGLCCVQAQNAHPDLSGLRFFATSRLTLEHNLRF